MSTEPNFPPALYRSEAFAEDLDPEVPALALPPTQRAPLLRALLQAGLRRSAPLLRPSGTPRPA